MNNANSETLKRLLFTEEPFVDESFIGYVMRLTEINDIPDPRWIMKVVGLHQRYDYEYKYNSDLRVNVEQLSMLTGVSKTKLKKVLYFDEDGLKRHIKGALIVFGRQLWHKFIVREIPKICPACLTEQIYCRRIWELSPVTTCPVHQCFLVTHCRKCERPISWNRPKMHICRCGFDFRKDKTVSLNAKELRLNLYLHQQFELPCPPVENVFKYPLTTLDHWDLLSLLFFVGAHFAEVHDFTGTSLSKCGNSKKIHQHLNQAIEVFDDWPKSYYEFIRKWKNTDYNYYISVKQIYLPGTALPRQYSEYELINQMLHHYLFSEQFLFMHEEFQQYLLGM